ncbi:MAG: hypothetical protein QXK12_03660 [Candidatus Nezhaarchaeales archaeon]
MDADYGTVEYLCLEYLLTLFKEEKEAEEFLKGGDTALNCEVKACEGRGERVNKESKPRI